MATINGDGGNNTLQGTSGADSLRGFGGNDRLSGLAGVDLLIGDEGNDTLDGGEGDDDLRGGPGDDLYIVDDTRDIDKALADRGTDTVRASVSYVLGTQQENLVLSGTGRLNGTGNASANTLSGNRAANTLSGGAGDDILNGGDGADRLIGGAGRDTLGAGDGDDILVFDAGDRLIRGGAGHDILRVAGTGQTVDLGRGPVYQSLEVVDLTGRGNNTLITDEASLLAASADFGEVRVQGNAGDRVGLGGLWAPAREIQIDGVSYTQYTRGTATLQVEAGVTTATASFGLSELNGVNGFRIDGIDVNDSSGIAVSGAGDINGDGFDDLILGAHGADPGGRREAGETYVVFGKAGTFTASLDLAALDGRNGFRLDGIDLRDYSGWSVSGAGDVNGDGYGDLIIGARGADPGGYSRAGETYVVFGQRIGFGSSFDLATLDGANGFRLDGVDSYDASGWAASAAGDVNGDGYDDLLVGAYGADPGGVSRAGETYVVFGKTGGFAANLDLATLDGTNGFRLDGINVNDYSGRSVSGAGDLNGDGFDDLLVGAFSADPGGDSRAGESYVVFGKPLGFGASLDLAALDGTNGFRLDGIDVNDLSGWSVSGAGDVNGDGYADLIIGAVGGDPGGRRDAGESYVVFGSAAGFGASLDLATLNGTNGFRLDGIDAGDQSGWSVSGAGDVNGDGFDDLIVGAINADPGGDLSAGETYVVFGKGAGFTASFALETLDGASGFRLDGVDAGDQSGWSVSGAGDVNGDGFDDLIVGAASADPGGDRSAGETYVIFGRDFNGAVDNIGTPQGDTLTGTARAEVLIGGRGADTLDGAGGSDVLKGGAGDDVLVFKGVDRHVEGDSGTDTLRFDGAGFSLNLINLSNLRYQGIEVIDLTGSGNNTLVLNIRDVLALPDASNVFLTDGTKQVLVDGNAGDTVRSTGQGWVAGAEVGIDGVMYTPYTHADIAAQLLVDSDITRMLT